jgi:hypothetical protein
VAARRLFRKSLKPVADMPMTVLARRDDKESSRLKKPIIKER